MEISIASGKGGTGKTTIATNLAVAVARMGTTVAYLDCDVEEPNGHLFLKPEITQEIEVTVPVPRVDLGKCTLCGECSAACEYHAIAVLGKTVEVFDSLCHSCGGCLDVCPEDAIEEIPRAIGRISRGVGMGVEFLEGRLNVGEAISPPVCVRHCPEQAIDFKDIVSSEWYISETPHGPLLHARLGLAQANSGKLVSLLRQQAKLMVEKRKADLIIVDGPPGIGCPVIASITGAGYVLIVTEPSMSALHDMERLMQLTAHFRIPTGICINKCDINPDLSDLVEERAQKLDIPVLGRIRHDKAVTRAQLNREPVVENGDSPAAGDIRTPGNMSMMSSGEPSQRARERLQEGGLLDHLDLNPKDLAGMVEHFGPQFDPYLTSQNRTHEQRI